MPRSNYFEDEYVFYLLLLVRNSVKGFGIGSDFYGSGNIFEGGKSSGESVGAQWYFDRLPKSGYD